MKHASIRETFRYWEERRGQRLAPERDEIEPAAIRKALGDSFVLSAEPDHPFRLAGTRVCALFCRELKGEAFLHLWDAPSRALVHDLLGTVTGEAVGLVAGATGRMGGEPPVPLELLLLPLHHRGSLARVLGVLAPLAPPYWLGHQPLPPMTLGAFRYLGPVAMPTPRIVPSPADLRRGFVIYQGGTAKSADTAETATDS